MSAYKTTAIVEPDGSLDLPHVPFRVGQRVEVEVQPLPDSADIDISRLRGAVIQYDDPTSSVAEDDWEAAS